MNIIFQTLQFIRSILPKDQKVKALGVSILLFINSGLELIGLSAMLPVFAVLLEDDVVNKYDWANWIYTFFGLTDDKQFIILLTTALFLIVVIKNIAGMFIVKLQSEFAMGLYSDFAQRLHQIYYRKGFIFFKEENSNILNRNVQGATQSFANSQLLGVLNILNEIIILLLIIISITIYDFKVLTLLSAIVIPSFLLLYRYVRNKSIEIGSIRQKVTPRLNKNIFQSIFGYVDVLISGSEQLFRNRMGDDVNQLVDVNIRANIYNLAPTRVIESALMLAVLVMNIYGVYYLESRIELLQLLGLFAIAGFRVMPSINRMMTYLNGLNQNKWTFNVLEPLKKEMHFEKPQQKELKFENSLILENVSFHYPNAEKNILKDFSLVIKKGETIGLIGASGSGKTTIMNILLGFLKVTKGQYLIDNQVFGEEYIDAFYHKVGYVQQSVYIIDGSLAENVAFGVKDEDIDFKKLDVVLKRASLYDVSQELENGIHTRIGENGTKLSGGQRQRVGIARALYFDAEILFFDEATSALDTQTEKEITESIHKLSESNLTIIIIAHRLSTLEDCDRIIEIKKRDEVISESN
ncbi:ABC transporter ATP-binding protein [Flammeovirga sp. EKP202]|uniref:ABC transporter ATP-binding protein n=1 Tax=Flammeovirga sp. EKP202 TaxID=2770592 RepID=UPI00165F4D95|nr:ABC transporter ATP-binding protein [Flammeovirga sp. EKP202]MBD0402247.1 ABC transporter ATP-binding protein [Flammeovirga sp. EKP202]